MYAALEDADFLVIVTEWTVFRTPDFDKMKSLMKSNLIFDGRNLFDLKDMEESGFHYYSIGRKTVITS
jgi:UDPglucose 6-dehydrogenase